MWSLFPLFLSLDHRSNKLKTCKKKFIGGVGDGLSWNYVPRRSYEIWYFFGLGEDKHFTGWLCLPMFKPCTRPLWYLRAKITINHRDYNFQAQDSLEKCCLNFVFHLKIHGEWIKGIKYGKKIFWRRCVNWKFDLHYIFKYFSKSAIVT